MSSIVQKKINHACKRVVIYSLVIELSLINLRCHVDFCSDTRGRLHPQRTSPCHAKVCQLEHPCFRNKDIIRLDISMHDSLLLAKDQCIRNIQPHADDIKLACILSGQIIPERIEQFHPDQNIPADPVVSPVLNNHVVFIADYVAVSPAVLQDSDLIFDPLHLSRKEIADRIHIRLLFFLGF